MVCDLSYSEDDSAQRFSGCPLIFIFEEAALSHAFSCREPALVCGRIIVSPRKFPLLNRSFYRRGKALRGFVASAFHSCRGRNMGWQMPGEKQGLDGESTHRCPQHRHFIHLEKIDRRATATGIVAAPNCGWSEPIATEIVENPVPVERIATSPLSIDHLSTYYLPTMNPAERRRLSN
jgi:hypothetical protein